MIRGTMSFLVGIYAGIYLSQNYELPRVDEPRVLWEKINSFAEKYRKPGPPEDK